MPGRTCANCGEVIGSWSPDWIPWHGKYISLFGNKSKWVDYTKLRIPTMKQWENDLRELGKILFLHTKESWEMRLGHVESIFYTYLKGEECSREKKKVKAVQQNSISSSESWVIIKSVALLRSNAVDTCLSTSLSFHYTRPSALAPWLPAMNPNSLAAHLTW